MKSNIRILYATVHLVIATLSALMITSLFSSYMLPLFIISCVLLVVCLIIQKMPWIYRGIIMLLSVGTGAIAVYLDESFFMFVSLTFVILLISTTVSSFFNIRKNRKD